MASNPPDDAAGTPQAAERARRDREAGDREQAARARWLALGASELTARPWQPASVPPSAVDLVRYAVWRSAEVTGDDLAAALALAGAARAEVAATEVGLLFAARAEGLTWAQIAAAMGFNSAQACQQHFDRLVARQAGP